MIDAPLLPGTSPLVVRIRPVVEMSDEQFFQFCQLNRELRFERTAQGELIIMTPAGGETSSRNSELNATLRLWSKQDGRGVIFDSSGGFILPNGAIRSPDAAWVLRSRLEGLTAEQKQKFIPLCPDFVVELHSPSDRVADLQDKMEAYIENGAQLGWLLVPETREVYIYQIGIQVTHLRDPETISGDPLLSGLVLRLSEIWDPGF